MQQLNIEQRDIEQLGSEAQVSKDELLQSNWQLEQKINNNQAVIKQLQERKRQEDLMNEQQISDINDAIRRSNLKIQEIPKSIHLLYQQINQIQQRQQDLQNQIQDDSEKIQECNTDIYNLKNSKLNQELLLNQAEGQKTKFEQKGEYFHQYKTGLQSNVGRIQALVDDQFEEELQLNQQEEILEIDETDTKDKHNNSIIQIGKLEQNLPIMQESLIAQFNDLKQKEDQLQIIENQIIEQKRNDRKYELELEALDQAINQLSQDIQIKELEISSLEQQLSQQQQQLQQADDQLKKFQSQAIELESKQQELERIIRELTAQLETIDQQIMELEQQNASANPIIGQICELLPQSTWSCMITKVANIIGGWLSGQGKRKRLRELKQQKNQILVKQENANKRLDQVKMRYQQAQLDISNTSSKISEIKIDIEKISSKIQVALQQKMNMQDQQRQTQADQKRLQQTKTYNLEQIQQNLDHQTEINVKIFDYKTSNAKSMAEIKENKQLLQLEKLKEQQLARTLKGLGQQTNDQGEIDQILESQIADLQDQQNLCNRNINQAQQEIKNYNQYLQVNQQSINDNEKLMKEQKIKIQDYDQKIAEVKKDKQALIESKIQKQNEVKKLFDDINKHQSDIQKNMMKKKYVMRRIKNANRIQKLFNKMQTVLNIGQIWFNSNYKLMKEHINLRNKIQKFKNKYKRIYQLYFLNQIPFLNQIYWCCPKFNTEEIDINK